MPDSLFMQKKSKELICSSSSIAPDDQVDNSINESDYMGSVLLEQDPVNSDEIRQSWLNHIRNNMDKKDFNSLNLMQEEGESVKDKLIVIYCSKDAPGQSGIEFIDNIRREKASSLADYFVFLIGSDTNSREYEQWNDILIPVYSDFHFKGVCMLPRTDNTLTLMKGLRDAEYSMATGSFSILEAKRLGINHCEYLSPPHLTNFGKILSTASEEQIENAFHRGTLALEALSILTREKPSNEDVKSLNIIHSDSGTKEASEPTAVEGPSMSSSSHS